MTDAEALDAYSRTVIRVAEAVAPSVAAVGVHGPRGGGAGSATVISSSGHLLTSAHVVEGASRVDLAFADGTEAGARVVGRDPLSDLAVLQADAPRRRRSRSGTPRRCGSGSSSSRSATRRASRAA